MSLPVSNMAFFDLALFDLALFDLDANALLFTALLRAAEAAAAVLPGLVVGLLVAGLLQARPFRAAVARWLAGDRPSNCLRAVALGVILPAGPVGVLPVLSVLHRQKVGPGTLLCLGVTTPAVGLAAWALLLDKLGLGMTLALLAAVLAPVLAAGLLLTRLRPRTDTDTGTGTGTGTDIPDAAESAAVQDVTSLVVAAGRLVPASLGYLLVAAGAAGLAAGLLPAGYYAHAVMEREPDHALVGLAVLPPALLPADTAALLAQQAVSSGTLWLLSPAMLLLGAGTSAGLAVWLVRRRTAGLAGLAAVLVLGTASAAAFDALLRDPGFTPLEDSHAFDLLNHPYRLSDATTAHVIGEVAPRAARLVTAPTLASAAAVLVLGVLSFAPARPKPEQSALDEPVPVSLAPARWLVGVACCASAVAAVYSYYPPPDLLADEMAFEHTQLQAGWFTRRDGDAADHSPADAPPPSASETQAILSETQLAEARLAEAHLTRLERLADRLPAAARLRARPHDADALARLRQHLNTLRRANTQATTHADTTPDPTASRDALLNLFAEIRRLQAD